MLDQTTGLEKSALSRDMGANLPSAQAVLESFAAHTIDTLMLVDAAGRIQSINRELAPLAPDEVVGGSSFDFLAEANHGRYREALRNACELGQVDRC